MLSASDIALDKAIPVFAGTGVNFAFLVPTETGHKKSIMDATEPVRNFLLEEGVHSYENQQQGPDNKVRVKSYFVNANSLVPTYASLYRPITKSGDPRIWFDGLKKYCSPNNLLALVAVQKEIYVFNLSNSTVFSSLENNEYAKSVLQKASNANSSVAAELKAKIVAIHKQGFLASITPGDPGVGDTLEHALGISRNNSKLPDYKGIELKASRTSRDGKEKHNRVNLFTRVPDEGKTYRDIIETYGKIQVPKTGAAARLQLYETTVTTRPNAYGLILQVNYEKDKLELYHQEGKELTYVSAWLFSNLKENLKTKHKETFWVKAVAKTIDGQEYFRYDKIEHTKGPNLSMLAPMFAAGKIMVDFAAHIDPVTKKWRDHGLLFKVKPEDLTLLFDKPEVYDLTTESK